MKNKIIFDFNNHNFKLNGIEIGDVCTSAEIKITPGEYPEVTLRLNHSLEFIADDCNVHKKIEAADEITEIIPATDETSSK